MAAVKHAQSADQSVNNVAKELGISGTTLRRWINEYDEYGESAFPGHGNALFNSTYEIKKLQKENEDLKIKNSFNSSKSICVNDYHSYGSGIAVLLIGFYHTAKM